MKRILLGLFALTLSLSAQNQPVKEYNLRTMSAEEIDRAAIGHTRYDFLIGADGGLIDTSGRALRVADLPTYFKENAANADAFYFLWTTPTSAPMDTLAPTLKQLGDQGITRIVVRHQARIVTTNKSTQPGKELAKSIEILRANSRI